MCQWITHLTQTYLTAEIYERGASNKCVNNVRETDCEPNEGALFNSVLC